MGSLWTGSCGCTVNAGPKLVEGWGDIRSSIIQHHQTRTIAWCQQDCLTQYPASFRALVWLNLTVHNCIYYDNSYAKTLLLHFTFKDETRRERDDMYSHQFTVNNDSPTQRLTVHSIYISPRSCIWKSDVREGFIQYSSTSEESTITITWSSVIRVQMLQRERSWNLGSG